MKRKSKAQYLGWMKDVLGTGAQNDGATAEKTPPPPESPTRLRRRRKPVQEAPETPYFGAPRKSGMTVRTPKLSPRPAPKTPATVDNPRGFGLLAFLSSSFSSVVPCGHPGRL